MRKEATIKILDEIYCVIFGLSDEDREYLHNIFSFYKAGYMFSPKYKLGRWDGKIYFFHKTGKTYVNLIEDIVPILSKMKYSFVLKDNRTAAIHFPEKIDENYFSDVIKNDKVLVLGNHQVDAVNAMIAAGNGIAVLGTGAGKTIICGAICKLYEQFNVRFMIIVPDTTLVRQTRRGLEFLGIDAGIFYGDEKDLRHQHVVSTWQSLNNARGILSDFTGIIVDECVMPETMIKTNHGDKPITDIIPGDMVLTINEETKKFEFKPVLKVYKNLKVGKKEKRLKINLDNGETIRITGNHKILTVNGWIRADELTKGDQIIGI